MRRTTACTQEIRRPGSKRADMDGHSYQLFDSRGRAPWIDAAGR